MTSRIEKRQYLVGMQYESSDEANGFFDIQRYVTITELALEVSDYLEKGKSSYPAFPAEAKPEILYAWDLDDLEYGDCYPELVNEINTIQSHNNRRR
jgi:hypothetical protein